ncbi:MAG: hypothetical protein ABWJ42_03190 [Sulfolobales archaeon]
MREELIDIHYIVSRIVNKYIALLGDSGSEREVREWLLTFREDIWRRCESPLGYCPLEKVDRAIRQLVDSYRRFLVETAYSYESKIRVYEYMRKILSEIEEYIRSKIPQYSIGGEIEKPSIHKLEIVLRPSLDKRERLYLEIIGVGDYRESFIISSPKNLIEIPVGSYQVRLLRGDSEIYRERVIVTRDTTLSIALEQIQKTREEKRIVNRDKIVADIRSSKRYISTLRRILRRAYDLNFIAIILLITLLIVDLIILLR